MTILPPRRNPASLISWLGGAALFLAAACPPLAAAPDLRFGTQGHFAQGWDLAWAPLLAQTGVGTVRDELYWSSIELVPGHYTFTAFDPYMAALKKAGLSPMIELDFSNPLYDGNFTPYDSVGFGAFAKYCTQVLAHYGAQINAVEIWNEYDGNFCTGPATISRPVTYTQMLQAAYPAIKAARPDVTVAAGATAWTDLMFFQQMFAAGALPYLDVLSCHPYRFTQPPEGLEHDMEGLQTLTRIYNQGRAKPVFVTEIGWYPHTATSPGDITIDDTVQAEFVVRSYALLLSAGVQRVYWYLGHDNPEIDSGNDLGLLTETLTAPLKPAALAMDNMTQQLSGAAFVRREGTPNTIYSMLFQRGDGTQVRVLWATQNTTLPSSGAVGAWDLEGNPLPVAGSFALTGSPIFVTGPWTGLPNQSGTVLADTLRDFTGTQGANGWSYGDYFGNTIFSPAPTFQLPASSPPQWLNAAYPWLSLTATDQLPSWGGVFGATQVAAVRRWTSTYNGTVEIVGQFQTEQSGGDGVGVSVVVNGARQFRQLIGTGWPATAYAFDLVVPVQVGTTIDFAVDPGPSTSNSYDATALYATITSVPVLADAQRDFAGSQGANGWSYGSSPAGAGFSPLPAYSSATGQWTDPNYPWISVTQGDQHPSYTGSGGTTPVAVVRRWTSPYTGTLEIAGQFRSEQAGVGGDGTGVGVVVAGQSLFHQSIGTGQASASCAFDLFVTVQVGTAVDFVVDPGPGTDIDYDATALSATITSSPVLADATRDFSATQGGNGWTYGSYAGGNVFVAAPAYVSAAGQWTNVNDPWLSLTRGDQHPSYLPGPTPAAAVRRWTSNYSGLVEVAGDFQSEEAGVGGDGVGVSLVVNGVTQFRQLIGTGQASSSYSFDVFIPVQAGSTIDFAVDPGAGTDIDYDATALSATITWAP